MLLFFWIVHCWKNTYCIATILFCYLNVKTSKELRLKGKKKSLMHKEMIILNFAPLVITPKSFFHLMPNVIIGIPSPKFSGKIILVIFWWHLTPFKIVAKEVDFLKQEQRWPQELKVEVSGFFNLWGFFCSQMVVNKGTFVSHHNLGICMDSINGYQQHLDC